MGHLANILVEYLFILILQGLKIFGTKTFFFVCARSQYLPRLWSGELGSRGPWVSRAWRLQVLEGGPLERVFGGGGRGLPFRCSGQENSGAGACTHPIPAALL